MKINIFCSFLICFAIVLSWSLGYNHGYDKRQADCPACPAINSIAEYKKWQHQVELEKMVKKIEENKRVPVYVSVEAKEPQAILDKFIEERRIQK